MARIVNGDELLDDNNRLIGFHNSDGTDTLLAAAEGSLTSYTPAGTGAVATNVQNKLRELVSVKDFGAVGDGATNDTSAIQAAIAASAGKELVFPSGHTFLASSLTVSSPMSIRLDGVLKMRTTSGTLMTISADDVCVYGAGTVDLNGTQDKGIVNTGNRFFISGLTFANMLGGAATVGSSSALNISNCVMPRVQNLKFKNIQKGTAPAPYVSQPRAMSFDTVDGAFVTDVVCQDVYVACVLAAVTDSTCANILIKNTLATVDNGFYIINTSNLELNNVNIYGWAGEPVVFSGCTNVRMVSGAVIDWSVNTIGVENCTDITLDGVRFSSTSASTVIKSRTANTSTVGLNLFNLNVRVTGTGDMIGFYNGAVNDLVVKGCVFNGVVDTGKAFANKFLTLTNTNQFAIEDNVWLLSETSGGVASAADWALTLVASKYSSVKRNTFLNRTTNGRFRVYGTDNTLISSDGLHNQANITGGRNPNYGLSTAEPRRFFGTAAPSAGTFVLGDTVWNTSPAAGGTIGWVCTTAGSPGTWKTFGAITA